MPSNMLLNNWKVHMGIKFTNQSDEREVSKPRDSQKIQ